MKKDDVSEKRILNEFLLEYILKKMFKRIYTTTSKNVSKKELYDRGEYFDMKIILIMTLTKMQIECYEDEHGKPMYQISINSDTPEYAKPTYPSDTKNKDTIQLIINKYTEMVFGTWEIPEWSMTSDLGTTVFRSGDEGTCCNKCEVQGTLGTINRCVGTNCGKPKCETVEVMTKNTVLNQLIYLIGQHLLKKNFKNT